MIGGMTSLSPEPGPIALVGSGEFLPQMVEVDRFLLNGRRPRAAFLPTAAGEEGAASVNRWLKMGTDHYASMGIEPVAVPVLNAADANDPALAALISDVGLVYLSGGNPGYVARTLRGSLVWDAIVAAWRGGAALAGCSAGAMALTSSAPDVRGGTMVRDEAATGVVSHLAVIPHFDQMGKWNPGFLEQARARMIPGQHLVGVDEDTALVGGMTEWTVMGRLSVSVFGPDGPMVYTDGQAVTLPVSS
jgi:cyanophycinase